MLPVTRPLPVAVQVAPYWSARLPAAPTVRPEQVMVGDVKVHFDVAVPVNDTVAGMGAPNVRVAVPDHDASPLFATLIEPFTRVPAVTLTDGDVPLSCIVSDGFALAGAARRITRRGERVAARWRATTGRASMRAVGAPPRADAN
jgi:hypothetical protein